ncbi:MAG: hypothetical protein HYZ54_03605 [Ignavibacteriae bacterium]|nr:hypothetical protein [Ignavibacteriota bacterium]
MGGWNYVFNVIIPVNVNGEICNVNFFYKYRQCGATNLYQYLVVGYTWPPPPCGISAYLNNLKATDLTAYYAALASIRAQAQLPCGEHFFKKIRLESLVPTDYDCLYTTGCETSGLGNVEIQTFNDKCIEFIDVYTPPNPATGNPGCPGATYFVDCGSGQCCVITRRMCYDNGIVRSCVTLHTGYGSGQDSVQEMLHLPRRLVVI